jgi:hypothetical protein
MALLDTSCGQVPLMMNNSVLGNSLDEPIFAVNNNHSNRSHFAIPGDWAYDGGDWWQTRI